MATAANLTFENIAHEALYRKGINIIGVADCISPHVLKDIDALYPR
jgi:PHP family Zn ribbon phosphoesterase